jgi:hypothetical protein
VCVNNEKFRHDLHVVWPLDNVSMEIMEFSPPLPHPLPHYLYALVLIFYMNFAEE